MLDTYSERKAVKKATEGKNTKMEKKEKKERNQQQIFQESCRRLRWADTSFYFAAAKADYLTRPQQNPST